MRLIAVSAGLFAVGWIVVVGGFIARLHWSSPWWFVPLGAFMTASLLGFMQVLEDREQRGLALLAGAIGFAGAMLYALVYVVAVFAFGPA